MLTVCSEKNNINSVRVVVVVIGHWVVKFGHATIKIPKKAQVTFLTCFKEVTSSNLGRDIDYPG
jgi:hypothetical protein